MTRTLVIDNYDSFTYNLVHFLGELGADITVVRNDKITLDEIAAMAPEAIVLSPGPSTLAVSSRRRPGFVLCHDAPSQDGPGCAGVTWWSLLYSLGRPPGGLLLCL